MENEDYCYELEDSMPVKPGDDKIMDELYIDNLIDDIQEASDLDE